VHKRARKIESSLHAAGVGLGAPVGRLGQPYEFEQLRGPGARLCPLDPVQPALQLEQLTPGLHRVEPDLLQRDADSPAHLGRVGDNVHPGHHGAARRGGKEGAEHAARRGLAGAVRTEEAEDLALPHGEIDAANSLDPALERSLQGTCLYGDRAVIHAA
jgi:hypothetical protein